MISLAVHSRAGGIHLPQKCGGGLGHDSASVKAARQSEAGQLCGYSSLEEEGWVETVTTQNAQSGQPHVLSQCKVLEIEAQKVISTPLHPEQLHNWTACG